MRAQQQQHPSGRWTVLACLAILAGVADASNITRDGNQLWLTIVKDCKTVTVACIERNVRSYVTDVMNDPEDYVLGDFLRLRRNGVLYDALNSSRPDPEAGRAAPDEEYLSPLEKMTEALHNSSLRYLMEHDLELSLPERVFEGALLKMSPRSFEGNGVLMHVELQPRVLEAEPRADGRFLKKIRKFIGSKLLMTFLSLMLIIKLISAKLMFILPLALGVGAAKKILLKVLLFFFPFLAHLFKLCSSYQSAYVNTKYHHHHHHISHKPGFSHHHVPLSTLPHVVDHPFHGHNNEHYQDHLEFSGPGLGPEYISHVTHRNTYDQRLGQQGATPARKDAAKRPLTPEEIEELALRVEKESKMRARLQQEQQRLRHENLKLQEKLKLQMKLQMQQPPLPNHPSFSPQHPQPQPMQHPQPQQTQHPQQQQLYPVYVDPYQYNAVAQSKVSSNQQHNLNTVSSSVPKYEENNLVVVDNVNATSAVVYDPFYTPILLRIDKVLVNLNIHDEPCREQLICSMYKEPYKFSPHSNLLSAELSRDSSELQRPTNTNPSVMRFFRYIQAARDGQDQRDCLQLYPCDINTSLGIAIETTV